MWQEPSHSLPTRLPGAPLRDVPCRVACAPMGTGVTRLAVAALCACAVLGGCSSDGPPLSRGAFIAKANTECGSLQQASDDFAKAQDPNAAGDDVARYVHGAADRLRALVRHVDALVPPDSMQDNVDRLLSDLAEYADGLDQLADTTQPGQTFSVVIQTNQALVGRMNAAATRAGRLVGDLGLVDCILPS